MIITVNAKRYARVLFELAKEKNRIDRTLTEFRSFLDLFDRSNDLRLFLNLPHKNKREKILTELLQGRYSELFYHFLLLIIKNKRINLIHQIYNDFENRVDSHYNRVKAVAITAVPIPEKKLLELNREIANFVKTKIRLHHEVDPSIIGGIIIRMNGKIFNASLSEQFQKLRHFLTQNQK